MQQSINECQSEFAQRIQSLQSDVDSLRDQVDYHKVKVMQPDVAKVDSDARLSKKGDAAVDRAFKKGRDGDPRDVDPAFAAAVDDLLQRLCALFAVTFSASTAEEPVPSEARVSVQDEQPAARRLKEEANAGELGTLLGTFLVRALAQVANNVAEVREKLQDQERVEQGLQDVLFRPLTGEALAQVANAVTDARAEVIQEVHLLESEVHCRSSRQQQPWPPDVPHSAREAGQHAIALPHSDIAQHLANAEAAALLPALSDAALRSADEEVLYSPRRGATPALRSALTSLEARQVQLGEDVAAVAVASA